MDHSKLAAIAKAKAATKEKAAIAEAQLNSIYAAAFRTDSGLKVLENLRNKLMSVEPCDTSELQLIHREGGRFVIKSILNRVKEGTRNG